MAAPVPTRSLTKAKEELLAKFYLALWDRLNHLTGEDKWMDVVPPNPPVEDTRIRDLHAQILASVDPNSAMGLEWDYLQFLEAMQGAMNMAHTDELKTRLRESGMRYLRNAVR